MKGGSVTYYFTTKDFPQGFLVLDNEGLDYINPDMFHDRFAHDVNQIKAVVMAVAQKPFNASIFGEKSGSPAWKQLPTWYQISESDRMIYPDTERLFAERKNASTLSFNSSHASLVSHPKEISELILIATNGSIK